MNDQTGALKQRAQHRIRTEKDNLVRLSRALHDDPETGWQEVRSAERVAAALERAGFTLTRRLLGIQTALHAVAGPDHPRLRIAFMAEYDALPGLGHACGHNLIAASAVGAAIGLAQAADQLGIRVEVFGTPAEEGGGGKIALLDKGAFDGLDLAMMIHPGPVDVARAAPLAVSHWAVSYTGRSAHAASFPTQGVNAADAFTIAQVAIGLLRQQLPPAVRIHGVVLEAGTAPNAIPAEARGRWYVRAPGLAELGAVETKVANCFQAGALATGCQLEITPESPPYAEFQQDEHALALYESNARALGRVFQPDHPGAAMAAASTDMGNVSHHIPAIHPYIGLDCYPVLNHQREFADHTTGPIAERALIDGATALAWTAIDWATPNEADGPPHRVSEETVIE